MAKEWDSLHLKIETEEKERLEENTDNLSGRVRNIIAAYNDAEDKLDLEDEMDAIDVAVLNTYINAIEKNITLLEQKKEKLEGRREEIKEDLDSDNDVLVEISLDLDGVSY